MDGSMARVTAGDGIDLMIAAGIPVEVKTFSEVQVAERNARILVRQTSPSPSSISAELETDSITLYVVPRLTDSLRTLALRDSRIAVAAIKEGIVIVQGEELQAMNKHPAQPVPLGSGRRVAWGRYGLLRALARTRAPRTQVQLAKEAGITQAGVSQVLKQLDRLVTKSADGWAAHDVRDLVDMFLLEYPGARGIKRHWFSLEAADRQAQRALDAGADADPILSGDVGADRIAPWRALGKVVLYGRTGVGLARAGFAEADAERASLEYIVPADQTIWATAIAYTEGRRPWTADPLMCAHDILRTGGPDAHEAVDRLVDHLAHDWAR